MPNEFTIVGENKDDQSHFLVVGTDGNYYGYFPSREQFAPIEPDDQWIMFSSAEALEEVASVKEGAEP